MSNTTSLSAPEELRQHIIDFLHDELVGPAPGLPSVQLNREEILRPQDPPRLRYGAGVLFPLRAGTEAQVDADQEEVENAGTIEFSPEEMEGEDELAGMGRVNLTNEAAENDEGVNLANEYLPSAMGITALVRLPARLHISVSAGQYNKDELEGAGWTNDEGRYVPFVPHWRIAIASEIVIDRSALSGEGTKKVILPVRNEGQETGLQFELLSRPFTDGEGENDHLRLITFTLINRIVARSFRPKDDECFFQCGFDIRDPEGESCFLEYPEKAAAPLDDEEASLRLLYRHRKVFAVGHGCAPGWDEPVAGSQTTTGIHTETIPTYEVRPIAPSALPGLELSMRILTNPDSDEALGLCQELAERYTLWIDEQQDRISSTVPDVLQGAAYMHMDQCRDCRDRMVDGIDLLRNNEQVRRAFGLMNRAMLMQQIHYSISANHIREWISGEQSLELERPFQSPDYDDPGSWGVNNPGRLGKWRPFQLAFILMNLRSMANPSSQERKTVDLIWFPTGGGKTEAYLGLAAFTILLRRFLRPDNAGSTVLMRYTLRLLTTQQFQRAASLICALEYLRRQSPDRLGTTPISIGLWVGSEVSPNKQSGGEGSASHALRKLHEGEKQNPFVVLSCPWCGARMGPVQYRQGRRNRIECKGYQKRTRPVRVHFVCDDDNCAFSTEEGLPLHVIDEAIYDEPPTLVIGTVDKFAMLPWKPEARGLFGVNHPEYDPPDLIIQDELHLISGPLGSMVGHYETVIDLLCEKEFDEKRVPAKIVASTATISRAVEQITALYGREQEDVQLFPPQALRAGDSFFAEEDLESPGRTYVGVFATALPSHVTAQIRVLSALFQAVKTADVEDESLRDPFWTLMVYFNSIRELGHAATLLRADIREYLNAVWDRLGLTWWAGGEEAAHKRRFINHALELTSRIHSSQIPESLQELFTSYSENQDSRPVDVCLATNMIQVGLDVPRLSLMTVVGQPKTTSEYIQATSRVGRQYPGLVVTVYNPARPRDRSHYEHFRAYHQSLYQYVEPTSVTPFAVPVRERALHALLIALVRFWGNADERRYPNPPPRDALFDRVCEVILDRVDRVDPDEYAETEEMLDDLITRWKRVPPPRYGDFAPPTEEVPLMYPSGSQQLPEWLDRSIPTPTSMRNVDAICDAQTIAMYPEVT